MGQWLEQEMSPRAPDDPEQVRQFAPKEMPPLVPKEGPPRSDGDLLDQSGQAIVALLQQAANLSNETTEVRFRGVNRTTIAHSEYFRL
jgi:hypothetical protein